MRQGELFSAAALPAACANDELALQRHQLLAWQERLAAFQAPLFAAQGAAAAASQGDLFAGQAAGEPGIDPLQLRPQALSFWRWPSAPQQGAALYFVIDGTPRLASPLLLYVGETGQADRRWKGEHDCKSYLAAYSEALRRADLDDRLTIRFWLDVPQAMKPRRQLEQRLIRHWQPPFNKETRERWATPFQAESP